MFQRSPAFTAPVGSDNPSSRARLRRAPVESRPAKPDPHQERLSFRGALQREPVLPRPRTLLVLVCALLLVAIAHELRTSALQSYLLSRHAAALSYEIRAGPSPRIVFPSSGPHDRELGYSRISAVTHKLEWQGYRIVEQAQMSAPMARLAALGVTPPYPEKAAGGLVIHGAERARMFDARRERFLFERFEDVPSLIVASLLFIEDRELLSAPDPTHNPAVDWQRLARATLLYAGRQLGLPLPVEGGSTLAAQIEKFRHSPGGRTSSVAEKLRQITAASLKAYRSGPDTRAHRRAIVVDYLNSMPLAGVPHYGQVHGLGEGLYAWFGLDLHDVRQALEGDDESATTAIAFKHALALLYATRAPTRLLVHERAVLIQRVNAYTHLLEQAGVIAPDFGERVRRTPLRFANAPQIEGATTTIEGKAVAAIRTELLDMLGATDFYELDRLDLEVGSTIDVPLQTAIGQFLRQLRDPEFLARHALTGERLLSRGDPADVAYTLLLYEATPRANLLRVHVDSLDRPFDLNTGMKMELGSTAKLRTLAHYLEVVAQLHEELAGGSARASPTPRDPITRWAVQTIERNPSISLQAFLQDSLDRKYSASPREVFFTGSGAHRFRNFNPPDNNRILSVRTALIQSTNLVFIRLMRDLVLYYSARLPYDAEAVLADPKHPLRRQLLEESATEEATLALERAYRRYGGLNETQVVNRVLRDRVTARRLAVLFYAWQVGADDDHLAAWLGRQMPATTSAEARRLARAYGNPRLTIADYGYLLDIHPLEIWCAGELIRTPSLSFEDLIARSGDAVRVSSAWLFHTRNRKAQDLRLRTRIERDAFARMTPYWRQLGFSFERLVPSLATAIGSSSDRPAALAQLMGIIVNDGWRRRSLLIEELRFAGGTPYHSVFNAQPEAEQVMNPTVARTLRAVLAEVVEHGTARRMKDAIHRADGSSVKLGGKTGSGDNRYEVFARGGQLLSSRALNRTATFVFYIGGRYFGVITASVEGPAAADYQFTSALPLAVLKLLAPQIEQWLAETNRRVGGGDGSLGADSFRRQDSNLHMAELRSLLGDSVGLETRFPSDPLK